MSYKLGLLVAFIVSGTAICCGTSEPSTTSDDDSNSTNPIPDMSTNSENSDQPDAQMPDTGSVDLGQPDMSEPGVIPDSITTAGASFAGVIPANSDVRLDLLAGQGDRVVMHLKKASDTSWETGIALYREGEAQPVTYSDPQGTSDAHIPWRTNDLPTGFEFWYADTYRLVLQNKGDVEGRFEFTLECLGGPCKMQGGDIDSDGVPDTTDNCPYLPNPSQEPLCSNAADPWTGASDLTLETALRQAKADVHLMFDYRDAREYMFGTLDQQSGEVECVYTGTRVATLTIPDTTLMNTEHTWPQSRGGDGDAKADLHHLFPVTNQSNIQRSNLHFGTVVNNTWAEGGSKRGADSQGDTRFEPRDSHKGDVARALFYIAVMYNLDMEEFEESQVRAWHVSDPVDDTERRRNQGIANFQNSRNPFIDYPHLVDRISDF